ncbi:monovalent cation/H(+) antiporter subunit G [Actinoplanes subglobosus]|uniref:Monovalent cation/H(+) antiporter subunit G n=1 Tax=Actinoplanes subglobosus TaxID=1547892 RepID=A0ABV8ITS3_9ACTN
MSVTAVLDAVAGVCLLGGALLSLAAGVGLLRFPDLLSRMHAATKPQVLGLLLILAGTAIRLGTAVDITTLVLVGVFQLVTAPVAAHMVGRTAYRARLFRRDLLLADELADDRETRAAARE